MTPAARVQAAIEVLDEFLKGQSGERALTAWARRSRYAGSGDRAAVRDHVYDALRHLRSYAAFGGGMSGRGIMIGAFRHKGLDLDEIFSGQRFAPDPVSSEERQVAFESDAQQYDIPDWLWPIWNEDLGVQACEVAENLRQRAPVFLRVNVARISRAVIIQKLEQEGIITEAHPSVVTALRVVSGARKISNSAAYKYGLVELQDASSQASVCALDQHMQGPVLDFCAGGGGKALALAAWLETKVDAHDTKMARMKNLAVRAKRAQADITIKNTDEVEKTNYNVVFCDVPCSGSGAWRRDPSGKWQLTYEQFNKLLQTQANIIARAAKLVRSEGYLVYATCSVLDRENTTQVENFLNLNTQFKLIHIFKFLPDSNGDGFYFAVLKNL